MGSRLLNSVLFLLLIAPCIGRAESPALSPPRFNTPSHILKSLGLFPVVYPLMDPRMSSNFGKRRHPVLRMSRHHSGIDLAADSGAPIRALSRGTVVYSDPYAGYGNLIVVKHAQGATTHYGHLQSFKVKPGEAIEAGTIIGTVGETGIVTGPHLHFELRLDGIAQDPQDFIPSLLGTPEG